MDIATIVREMIHDQHFGGTYPKYHIRISQKNAGPQLGGNVEVLDVLYRREGESEEDFLERATRYTEELDIN